MYDSLIKLVSVKNMVDEYGDSQESIKERPIFAELKSIGTTEFYQAQAVGMKPELKFIIPDYLDYNGEKVLKYKEYTGIEETYSIIRTYRTGNELEITVRKGLEQ